ncbi:MAG: T9SS type A sorting domain-containing protein [Flavobacteriales bacterium]|nr:T9SS type A sorting domain-containing protein [Flavobacteriales bacterium]
MKGSNTFALLCAGSFNLLGAAEANAQVLEWAGRVGGTGVDQGLAMAVDPLDRLVSTGSFQNTVDFNPDVNFTDPLTANGSFDLFVTWTNTDGSHVRALSMGGTGEVWPAAVATDAQGNCFLTGYFIGSFDADPGPGVANVVANGSGQDIFVVALDSTGAYLWSASLGSTLNDRGTAVAVDDAGGVLVGGWFNNTVDFDPGSGTASLSSAGGADAFVLKLSGTGAYQWAHRFGSTSGDEVHALDAGPDGEVYVVGSYRGTVDFDPGAGTDVIAAVGNEDAFMLKLDETGQFRWAGSVGGTNVDRARSVAVHANDAVYVAGTFSGASADLDPGPGTQSFSPVSTPDAFLLRLDTAGVLDWAAQIGGPADEDVRTCRVNASGLPVLCGTFTVGVDLDPGPGTFNLTSAGSTDIFLAQYTDAGQLAWGLQQGGTNFELCAADLDAAGNVYTAGMFVGSMDLDPGPTDLTVSAFGANDVFIQKFGDITTGLQAAGPGMPLQLFPHPASDQMTVSSPWLEPGAELVVHSALGAVVHRQPVLSSGMQVISLSALQDGAYIVCIIGPKGSATARVLKFR